MSESASQARAGDRPLIGSDDPPPVQVVNPDGAGEMLFVCDHASAAVPRAMDNLGLDESVRRRHVAWDIGSAEVARRLAARFDAPLVLSGYSRLLIDCNRSLDDPTSIARVSEDTVIPANQAVTPAEAASRAEAFFWPYHRAIEEALKRLQGKGIAPPLISVHSFTPVFKGVEQPWHIGVLWNRDPRIAVPLMERLGADPAIVVGDNRPYSAREGFGYSIETHGERAGLAHVLVETRQDLIVTRRGVERWADILGRALAEVFADPALFRVRYF